jgi:hypothetical protein
MTEQTREWRPSPDEVRRIVDEMRPILRELAEGERARATDGRVLAELALTISR